MGGFSRGGGGQQRRWQVTVVGGLVVVHLLSAGTVAGMRTRRARASAPVAPVAAAIASVPATTVPRAPDAPRPAAGAPAPLAPPQTAPPQPAPPPTAPPDPRTALRTALSGALAGVAGCLVVQDGDEVLYASDPDVPLAPASTQKLLVAAAALSRLGPDLRFVTKAVARQAPRGGAVDAVWLVGGGDPLLSTPGYAGYLAAQARNRETPTTPLAALADGLAASGVRSVTGGVRGDDARYERLRYVESWKPSYRTEPEIGPLGALTVDGGLQAWQPKEVAVAEPASYAAASLARLLSERGIAAAGSPDEGAPAGAVVLAEVRSAPMAQIVADMLRSSDNLTAELLVRELDRQAGGTGTTAGGAKVVAAEAQRLGLPTAGLHLADGSGLDTGNRASCGLLLRALQLGDRPGFRPLTDGLAVAGRTGTLARRYVGTPLAGRLAAKTGSIDCVVGMVGRVDVTRHLRFALLGNGVCGWPAGKTLEDRVVTALAEYPG